MIGALVLRAQLWLAQRWAWVVGVVGGVLALVLVTWRHGARRAAEARAEAHRAGLEAARADDAQRDAAELVIEAEVEATEAQIRETAAQRAEPPHTLSDLEAAHARVEARRAERGRR